MKPCVLSTSPLSAATWLLIVQVFNITLTPIYGFAPQALHSATPVLQSLPNDTSGSGNGPASVQARSEERKIRANYFLQSSGFSPSKSIISTLLGDEPTADSDAKQFMAALEQSNRQALLERVHGVGEEYKDYVEETANEWKKEWEFRQIASKMAAEKAKVKQQERLDTLMAMVSGSGAIAQANVGANDGRLRFGMPYGERKEKKRANDDEEEVELPTAAPFDVVEETFPKAAPLEVVEEPKTDTPILSQIMEEKDKESDDAVVSEERIKAAEENTTILEPASKSDIAKDSKASANDAPAESITDEQNPLENLSLVQAAKSEDSKPAGNEAEKAAAEQRAANAKAAQEKADARKQQIIVAETKKKEEAKAQADAILNQAAQEARLKIEKEQAQAVERQKREEEDARLKAEEEVEKARKQKEIEELAKQQAAEEAAKEEEARLKAEEEARLKGEEEARQEAEAARLHAEAQQQRIDAVESKMQSLTDKATSVTFNAKLEDGLFLVGVGVRKKAIINVYSVAMYSSPAVLEAVSVFPKGKQKKEAQVALRDAARSFDSSNPQTTFVLEMTFKADGKTIASAIADSVKPRYAGPEANVKELESLIFEGVKSKGGQATKGTIFRFDCSAQGVAVSVDGNDQGQVECDSLGSAFVDVFMDDKAVSPKLVDSCIETWSGSGL